MSQNEFLPLILLFLFGGFAVLSAVLKARARVRVLLAVALAVLEGLSGMALMACRSTRLGLVGDGYEGGDPHCGVGGRFVDGPHTPRSVIEAELARRRRAGVFTRRSRPERTPQGQRLARTLATSWIRRVRLAS
jgi:hypothetical protein